MEEISFFWIFLIIVTCGFGAILYILVTHDGKDRGKKEIKEKEEIEIGTSPRINPLKGLTKRQKDILQYIIEKKEANPPELRKVAGDVSERTVRRDMNTLVERGLVLKEGTTKSTYYKYTGE